MYENGKNIFDTMNMYNNIPIQVHNDKMNTIFNTENDIRNNFFNDKFIDDLVVNSKTSKNKVIQHIIDCLKPIIYQNTSYNIIECKSIIMNTLIFKNEYMGNINTQLDFLFSEDTKEYIKSMLYDKIPNNYEVNDVYIRSVIKNQIDRHSKNNREINSSNISVKYNVYINQATNFTEREIFHIINNTIENIVNKVNSDSNISSNNSKLNKWNTVLGHNNNDITQNINIKLNTKKPKGMQFNMTY